MFLPYNIKITIMECYTMHLGLWDEVKKMFEFIAPSSPFLLSLFSPDLAKKAGPFAGECLFRSKNLDPVSHQIKRPKA